MKFNNLLCVKSIITIIIVIAACVLTFLYPETLMESFKTALTMIVTFYFAHQSDKKQNQNNDNNKQ